MATDEKLHGSLPHSKSVDSVFTLESVYIDALSQVERLHGSGTLSKKHYNILLHTTRLEDLLTTCEKSAKLKHDQNGISKTITSAVTRITRYSDAIDMIAQSSPQAYGLNVVGLVWGSLKFLLVVARDISAIHDLIVETIHSVHQLLPNLGALIKIYGDSEIKLLYKPLVEFYKAIISFGLRTAEYLSRDSHSSKTIARSAWTSLRAEFEGSRSRLQEAVHLIEQAAGVEHMYTTDCIRKDQTSEVRRQEEFRGEIRRRLLRPSDGVQLQSSVGHLPFNDAPTGLLSGHFTGRVAELARLDAVMSFPQEDNKPRRCAMVGMPGLGKTQTALKVCDEYFHIGKARLIFWVSCTTAARFTQGYSAILELVEHVDRDHSDPKLKLAAAQRWLERDCETQCPQHDGKDVGSVLRPLLSWLLVCDSINEEIMPLIRQYLPRYNHRGAILLTTRHAGVAKALVPSLSEGQQIMNLGLPDCEEAVHLLCAELEDPSLDQSFHKPPVEISKAEELVHSLGLLPFAISQAASFANQSSKDLDYMLRLCQGEHKMQILSWDNRLATYEQGSVMAIFDSRLAELNRTDPLTAMLLHSISLMDAESIPVDCLEIWGDLSEPSSFDTRWVIRDPYDRYETSFDIELFQLASRSSSDQSEAAGAKGAKSERRLWTRLQAKLSRKGEITSQPVPKKAELAPADFRQAPDRCTVRQIYGLLNDTVQLQLAIQKLKHLALISAVSEGRNLRFHDLAQLMVRQNMKSLGMEYLCFDLVARTLQEALFSSGNPRAPGCWPVYERLLPHVQSLLSFHETLGKCSHSIAWVARMMAMYLRFRDQAAESTEMLEKVVLQQEKYHGPEDLDLLRNMATLAASYNFQGEWEASLPLAIRVAETRKRLLGRQHAHYLTILPILATVKRAQGEYQETELLLREALEGFQSLPDERNVKRSMNVENDIAQLFAEQGRYADSIEIYERILRERREYLSPEDHTSITLTTSLAFAYSQAGHLIQARQTYEQTIEIMEKAWGSDHPHTLAVMHDLGREYDSQRRWGDAEIIYNKALQIQIQQWGQNHTKTLTTMELLAHALNRQKRFERGIDLQRRVVDELQDQHGIEQSETLRATDSLATYLRVSENYEEAAATTELLLRIRKKGQDHSETIETMVRLGEIQFKQGKFQEAYDLLNDALAIQEKDSNIVASSLSSTQRILGDICFSLDKDEKAERLYKAAWTGLKSMHEWPHQRIACITQRLGLFYLEGERWAEAEPLLRSAMEGWESMLQNSDQEYNNAASQGLIIALESLERYDEADQLRQRVRGTHTGSSRQSGGGAKYGLPNPSGAQSAIDPSKDVQSPCATPKIESTESTGSTESSSDDDGVFYEAEAFNISSPGLYDDTEDLWERMCSLPRYASKMRSIYI